MKKILSILLAIMMMVSVFAGCSDEAADGNENNSEAEGESGGIVVESLNKSFTAVIYGDEDEKEFWNEIKDAFESANQGVTINMIISEDAAYEVRDRILSGNSPDFVYLPSDEESGVTNALIKDKAMTDISDIVAYAPSGAFENNICKPYDDGKAYIAPYFFETEGLIYNKELLSENGFSVPETWDDFVAIAEACKNKNFSFYTYSGAEPSEFVSMFAAALVPVIGIEEVAKLLDCEKEAWENDSVTAFAEQIESVTKLVVSGSSTKSREDVIECLEEGEALFISGTGNDLEELNKDEEKYAICDYPVLSRGSVNIVSFSEMYIPIEAKEAELAKQFIAFLYGDTAMSIAYEKLGKTAIESGKTVFAPEFAVKSAGNETLSDEFCALVVDIFKGNVDADEFKDKMLEYIEEY